MADIFEKLLSFYKAQAIKDPVALATYVTRRYGSMDKFAMARGMVGKKNAKNWNPVKNTAGSKTGKSANAPKGGPRQRPLAARVKTGESKSGKPRYRMQEVGPKRGEGGKKERFPNLPEDRRGQRSQKSIELDKAQAIED